MNICTGWSPPCTDSRETISAYLAHASVKVKDVASAASDGAHFS